MRLYKMTRSGNDFVFVDGRDVPPDRLSEAEIRSLCDRRTGVGGDGVVTLTPEGDGAARMVYFNADGSRAGMWATPPSAARAWRRSSALPPRPECSCTPIPACFAPAVSVRDGRPSCCSPILSSPRQFPWCS